MIICDNQCDTVTGFWRRRIFSWFKLAENDAKYVADQAINQHNEASAPDTFWSVEVSTEH